MRALMDIEVLDSEPAPAITAPLCMRCHSEIKDATTSHHGRIVKGFTQTEDIEDVHKFVNGQIVVTPTRTTKYFPEKVTGHCCFECYTALWNTTWRTKDGKLRRAFEHVLLKVEQPINDDHDFADITKGLYAPHAGRGASLGTIALDGVDRESELLQHSAARLDQPAIDKPTNELAGFGRDSRPRRTDIKLKAPKVIVKRGKWKVKPEGYNVDFTPSK